MDSGADCSTIPEDTAANLPYDIYVHQDVKHMEYGNGQVLTTNQEMHIGNYPVCIMPTEAAQTLISVGEVVDGGHTVTFAPESVSIRDTGGRYQVTYDRAGNQNGKYARPWIVPLSVLMELTNQRAKYYPTVDNDGISEEELVASSDDDNDRNDQRNNSSSNSSSHLKATPNINQEGIVYELNEETISTNPNYSNILTSKPPSPLHSPAMINYSPTQRRKTRFSPPHSSSSNRNQQSIQPHIPDPKSSESALVVHVNQNESQPPSNTNTQIVNLVEDESDFNNYYYQLSARLRRVPDSNSKARVMNLHHRMAHAPEDVMCLAIQGKAPLWKHTRVEPWEIRRVFRRHQCLACILAKRRAEGQNKWTIQKEKKKVTFKPDQEEQLETKKSSKSEDEDEPEPKWTAGQCISIDDIGPISPISSEGYQSFFYIKDLFSKKVFTHLVDSVNAATYLEALDRVRKYFSGKGFKLTTVRSDFRNIYRTPEVDEYIQLHNIDRQNSSPYHKWQNAVEREVQTMVVNMSAIIHGQILLRADAWSLILEYYCNIHNALPNTNTGTSPNHMIDSSHVDADYQFKYELGELVCYGIPKEQRTWKFDVKNEIGIYVGDEPGTKGSYRLYLPYDHKPTVRADVASINISEVQLMAWYSKRRDVQEGMLPYRIVEDALIDLLAPKDEPQNEQPTEQANGNNNTSDEQQTLKATIDIGNASTSKSRKNSRKAVTPPTSNRELRPKHEPNYAPRYQNSAKQLLDLPSTTKTKNGKVKTWEQYVSNNEDDREVKPPGWDESMRLYILAMTTYYNEAIHITGNDLAEEIETSDALNAPDRDKFIEAIRKEVFSLIHDTKNTYPN
jgi:hypothetical protein